MDVGTLKVYGTLSVAGSGKVSLSNHTHPGKTGPQGFSLHRINESYTWINDNYVYGKVKNKLIRDGFIYRCPFCLDVSHEYAKPTKKK